MVARNKKEGKSAALIMVAIIVLAALVAFGLYSYLKTTRKTVYLFNGSYPAGTAVTGSMFEPMEIDGRLYDKMETSFSGASYATADEINDVISRKGKLRVDVVENLPATNNVFGDVAFLVENNLSDNLVAVELPCEKVSGIYGRQICPGTKINLVSTYTENEKCVSEIVCQAANVVGTNCDADGNVLTAYIELSPTDALAVVNALDTRTVSATIVSPNAYLDVEKKDAKYERSIPETPVMAAPVARPMDVVEPAPAGE